MTKKYNTLSHLKLERTFQEIGDELGCTAQAVEHVQRRALAKLTRIVKEKFGDTVKLEDLLPAIKQSMEENHVY